MTSAQWFAENSEFLTVVSAFVLIACAAIALACIVYIIKELQK